MSSKKQLNEYVKRLKKERSALKKVNKEYEREIAQLTFNIFQLKKDLDNAKINQRKWYHFF